jgi:hypothetical protein
VSKHFHLVFSSLLIGLLALFCSPKLFAQANSTPEERAHWIELMQKLEVDPLNDSLNQDAEAAVKRLMEVHDIHVALCGHILADLQMDKKKYSGTITRQYLIASSVYVIQNSDKAGDTIGANLAALGSVLKTYRVMVQKKSDAKSKGLDALVQQQSGEKLEEYVHQRCG